MSFPFAIFPFGVVSPLFAWDTEWPDHDTPAESTARLDWPVPLHPTMAADTPLSTSARTPTPKAARPFVRAIRAGHRRTKPERLDGPSLWLLSHEDQRWMARDAAWPSTKMVSQMLQVAVGDPELLTAWGQNPRVSAAAARRIAAGLVAAVQTPWRGAVDSRRQLTVHRPALCDALVLWAAVRQAATGRYPAAVQRFATPSMLNAAVAGLTAPGAGEMRQAAASVAAVILRLDAHRGRPVITSVTLRRVVQETLVSTRLASRPEEGYDGCTLAASAAWVVAEAMLHPNATSDLWQGVADQAVVWHQGFGPQYSGRSRTGPSGQAPEVTHEAMALIMHALALRPEARQTPAVQTVLDALSYAPAIVALRALDLEGHAFARALAMLADTAPPMAAWVLAHPQVPGLSTLNPIVLQPLLEHDNPDVRFVALNTLGRADAVQRPRPDGPAAPKKAFIKPRPI